MPLEPLVHMKVRHSRAVYRDNILGSGLLRIRWVFVLAKAIHKKGWFVPICGEWIESQREKEFVFRGGVRSVAIAFQQRVNLERQRRHLPERSLRSRLQTESPWGMTTSFLRRWTHCDFEFLNRSPKSTSRQDRKVPRNLGAFRIGHRVTLPSTGLPVFQKDGSSVAADKLNVRNRSARAGPRLKHSMEFLGSPQ